MKKSKIIVPALGILLLSTAASVSGSVAWFTANRQFNASIGNFTVVSTTADLECTFTPGVGTENDTGGAKTLKVSANTTLTDGSFDHNTKYAYFPSASDGSSFDRYLITGTKATDANESAASLYRTTDTETSTKIYTALTWKMVFTLDVTGSETYGLFLDFGSGKTRVTTAAAKQTDTGFRIAFVNDVAATGARKVVWAPNQTFAKTKYFSAADAAALAALNKDSTGTSYTAYAASPETQGDVITSDTASAGLVSLDPSTGIKDGVTASTVTSKANYMGAFNSSNETITFLCVAWFEGTDENVINGKTLSDLTAHLYFETRKLG